MVMVIFLICSVLVSQRTTTKAARSGRRSTGHISTSLTHLYRYAIPIRPCDTISFNAAAPLPSHPTILHPSQPAMSLPRMVEVIAIQRQGDLDVIEQLTLPFPKPGPKDIIVKVCRVAHVDSETLYSSNECTRLYGLGLIKLILISGTLPRDTICSIRTQHKQQGTLPCQEVPSDHRRRSHGLHHRASYR